MDEIYERLSNVMADVGAITKDQEHKFGERYKFRGIDDVYNSLSPALVKHGVLVIPEVIECHMDTYLTSKEKVMQRAALKITYHFYAPDGSSVTATVMGEGADVADKSINKAHSSAFKNAIFQSLCIPTETGKSDSEFDSPDGQSPRTAREPSQNPPQHQALNPDRSAIGKRLLVAMESRCVELKLSPADCAKGALNAIIDKLKIAKTAAELTTHHHMVLDHIEVWHPPSSGSDDFAAGPPEGSETKEHTLGTAPKEMASLHVWMGEDMGIRNSKDAHAALHAALPAGVDSLRDLPVSRVADLKARVRTNERGGD
jgi:hypothetical protein